MLMGAALAAFCAACFFGGQALRENITAGRAAEQPDAPATQPPALVTPTPGVTVSLAPLETETPAMSEPASNTVTVTRDEKSGDIIISRPVTTAGVPTPLPTANVAGGGGELPTVDGVYYGDHPGETSSPAPEATPVSTPAPAATPVQGDKTTDRREDPAPSPSDTPYPIAKPSSKPTPAPTPAPTPKPSQAPETTPAPEATPTPSSSPAWKEEETDYSTKPDWVGTEGERTPDGKWEYGYVPGFGWDWYGTDDGGLSGIADFELTGNHVGTM